MSMRSKLRGAVIERLLSERGIRLAAGLRRLRPGPQGPLVAFLQLDDPRSLLVAQVLQGWEQRGVALPLALVSDPDRAYDPEPSLRRGHDEREAPMLAAAFGLRWEPGWRRPSAAALQAAHGVLLGAGAIAGQGAGAAAGLSAELYLQVAERIWSGHAAEGGASDLGPLPAAEISPGEVALRLEQGRRELLACGQYLAPVIAVERDPYFGLMRLNAVAERLRERGLPAVPLKVAPAAGWPLPSHKPRQLTMFHSFRSPYSYLALQRAADLAERHQLQLTLKPVLPMVMRGLQVPGKKRMFIARDAARQARRHNVPYGRICDPLGPGIARCLALFCHAAERDKGLALAISLGRGIWSQALDVGDETDLARMVERAGLGWPSAQAALSDERWRQMVERHRQELTSHGLWGVPSFLIGDLALWGQDRLGLIDAWLAAQHS